MCQFLSAVVSKSGEVYCNPFIDSHEEIIQYFNLRDDPSQFINNIVRVEFTPKDDDYFGVENYQLRVDENSIPSWWVDVENSVRQNLTDRIKRMVIDKAENKILCGGVYFVRDSKILWTRYTKILTIRGNSTIGNVRGNSTIGNVRDNSTIENVRDNSTIENVRDNSTIENVRDNSTIGNVRDNSTIENVRDNSTIENVRDNSTIGNVRDNSTIGNQSEFNISKKGKIIK
jgi:hypothetical protein